MDLGGKIKAARLEAGFSQRQLCGDTITRNMLSQIENGAARPSMNTLRYLAQRLEKPVSYFLEEQAVTLPNRDCIFRAGEAFAGGDAKAARQALEDFREPDEIFLPERELLWYLTGLELARQAIAEDRLPYGAMLLRELETASSPYITADLKRRRLILLGQTGEPVVMPNDDDALLLRAVAALSSGNAPRCLALLAAAEDQSAPYWNLLQAHGEFALGQYEKAAAHYRLAEADYPKDALPRLEICYREQGDYKLAYEYACKQK